MRTLLSLATLVTLSSGALAQGAILETLDSLKSVGAPPGFRGNVPDHVDLSPKMPPARTQGGTSSCVSWAATYAAASFALRARGLGANLILSPSFTYNQLAKDQWCRLGTSVSATLNLLRDVGAVPIQAFAFDGGWCGRLPTTAELEMAKGFRIKTWSALDATAIDKVKEQLARGVPVIFTMRSNAKISSLQGDAVLTQDDAPGEGHAMVAVGYVDEKNAFLIENSFGPGWGTKGFGWFGYDFWKRNVGPGYVIE